jgi:hypothetical protein
LATWGLFRGLPILFEIAVQALWPGLAPPTLWSGSSGWAPATLFVCAVAFFNASPGRWLEGYLWERLAAGVARVRNDLVGFLQAIVEAFQWLVDVVERGLYAVDEWLRFRGGDHPATLALKAPLAAVWSIVSYLLRVFINVFFEPQVNPIKHFPVVTVSHKMLLPLSPQIKQLLAKTMDDATAITVTGAALTTAPGAFGFLAWELLANWKLYAANRPATLAPAAFGSHGETMATMLRPGFHSGTAPKQFAKLRAAGWEQRPQQAQLAMAKASDRLEHTREAVAAFVERQLLAPLRTFPEWRDAPVRVAEVEVRPATIQVRIEHADAPGKPWRLDFVESAGSLQARIADPGFTARGGAAARSVCAALWEGFAQRCGARLDTPPVTWRAWRDLWSG